MSGRFCMTNGYHWANGRESIFFLRPYRRKENMSCPTCRREYKKALICTNCEILCVPAVDTKLSIYPPSKQNPEYVKYVNLYSSHNEAELASLKSIFDTEGISYFVKNGNPGTSNVDPRINSFNTRMIEVLDDQYEKARNILTDHLDETKEKSHVVKSSVFDKVRMTFGVLVFGWLMQVRTKKRKC
jgi:hypothetical protein